MDGSGNGQFDGDICRDHLFSHSDLTRGEKRMNRSKSRMTKDLTCENREKEDMIGVCETVFQVENLDAWFGEKHVLRKVYAEFQSCGITAIMGPSGCGKSTLLRSLNRLNDSVPTFRLQGKILYRDQEVYEISDLAAFRKRVTMVFQRPNPFPMSIFDNVAYGPRLQGVRGKTNLQAIVQQALEKAALWDEVKDELKKPAVRLSGGQQQRLCIARALAVDPDVILLDEPTAALDPIATTRIERLLEEISSEYTVLIVTHSMGQALRISDQVIFIYEGVVVESGDTNLVMENPQHELTKKFLTGRIG